MRLCFEDAFTMAPLSRASIGVEATGLAKSSRGERSGGKLASSDGAVGGAMFGRGCLSIPEGLDLGSALGFWGRLEVTGLAKTDRGERSGGELASSTGAFEGTIPGRGCLSIPKGFNLGSAERFSEPVTSFVLA